MEDEPKAQKERKLLLSLQIRQRKWDWLLGDWQSACRCPFSFPTTAPAVMRLDGQMPVSPQLGWRVGLAPQRAAKERGGREVAPKLCRLDCTSAGNSMSWKPRDGTTDEKPVHQQEWCVCLCVCARAHAGAFFSTAVSTIDSSRHILSKQPV